MYPARSRSRKFNLTLRGPRAERANPFIADLCAKPILPRHGAHRCRRPADPGRAVSSPARRTSWASAMNLSWFSFKPGEPTAAEIVIPIERNKVSNRASLIAPDGIASTRSRRSSWSKWPSIPSGNGASIARPSGVTQRSSAGNGSPAPKSPGPAPERIGAPLKPGTGRDLGNDHSFSSMPTRGVTLPRPRRRSLRFRRSRCAFVHAARLNIGGDPSDLSNGRLPRASPVTVCFSVEFSK